MSKNKEEVLKKVGERPFNQKEVEELFKKYYD